MLRKLAIVGAFVLVAGCSANDPLTTLAKNFNAVNCTQANIDSAVLQVPTGVVPPQVAKDALTRFCAVLNGTQAGPAPAPGMSPVIK